MTEIDKQIQRPRVPAMDAMLGVKFDVIDDKSFIRIIDYMGDDSSIVQAARVSYGAGTRSVSDDAKLINYLMEHNHSSPFEMCEIKFHIKAPLFVARQWMRHRTASINEVSLRYSEAVEEFYVPALERIREQSKINKQGSGEPLPLGEAILVQERIKNTITASYYQYERLRQDSNVSRETARMVLPSNIYTEWYWKINLHNLFHFIETRSNENAQYEIRAYAIKIGTLLVNWVPLASSAFAMRLLSK